MKTPTFTEFSVQALAKGFDEVLERSWDPLTVLHTHTHPFAVEALVLRGELWLTTASGTQHLKAGDHFSLERNVPHEERYGPDGATNWVARKNR